jgi:type IV secretory pathway VirB3-like protein
MIHQESPLIGCGSFDKIITYHNNLEAIITLLNRMRNLTQSFEGLHRNANFRNTPSPDYIIDFVAEPQHDYKIPLLTLPLISRCNDSSHHHVLDTLTAATALYAGALTNPAVDFGSTMNEEIFQQLCTAMAKCSHDGFWARYPGILLWVLLIGTATARGRKEAAFWMFYLSRTGRFSDAETWLVGSAAIRRFIDIQRWIREENA